MLKCEYSDPETNYILFPYTLYTNALYIFILIDTVNDANGRLRKNSRSLLAEMITRSS